jgi:hypothetical protein
MATSFTSASTSEVPHARETERAIDDGQARLFAGYRQIRDRYVNTEAPPVSTFIYVPRLAQPNWLFEMDAMAVLDG